MFDHCIGQEVRAFITFTCDVIFKISRYPYFPAVDDNIALSHIAALLGSAGLKDAAQALGRKLTITELPESTEPVQQIVKQQRLSSKIILDEGLYDSKSYFTQDFHASQEKFSIFFLSEPNKCFKIFLERVKTLTIKILKSFLVLREYPNFTLYFLSTFYTLPHLIGSGLKSYLDKIETSGSEWREVTDLLIQLLQPNPKNRPNACQALDMEFFTKHS